MVSAHITSNSLIKVFRRETGFLRYCHGFITICFSVGPLIIQSNGPLIIQSNVHWSMIFDERFNW